ncbi:MAG: hypothetical protein IT292_04605 [Deltaproteobacteria bacterium]|nr:hypothetical protein [Deltaproteobacteria bacterium]
MKQELTGIGLERFRRSYLRAGKGKKGENLTSSGFRSVVQVTGPAEAIYSTLSNNIYRQYTKSYLGAAHVAGIASLMLVENPDLTPMEVITKLKEAKRSSSNIVDANSAVAKAKISRSFIVRRQVVLKVNNTTYPLRGIKVTANFTKAQGGNVSDDLTTDVNGQYSFKNIGKLGDTYKITIPQTDGYFFTNYTNSATITDRVSIANFTTTSIPAFSSGTRYKISGRCSVYIKPSGEWKIKLSKPGGKFETISFDARPNAIPLAIDYDGDGFDEAVVYDTSNIYGIWFFYHYDHLFQFQKNNWYKVGQAGDLPMTLNLDGDNRGDIYLYRPSTNTIYNYVTTKESAQAIYLPDVAEKNIFPNM